MHLAWRSLGNERRLAMCYSDQGLEASSHSFSLRLRLAVGLPSNDRYPVFEYNLNQAGLRLLDLQRFQTCK